MFIPGHVGITFFLAYMLSLSPISAAIGVLIPDLIDKPLKILDLVPFQRYIGHTLLGVFLSFVITYLITRNKIVSLSMGFGYFTHLLEDLPYFIPWFYPFIDYSFPVLPFSFQYTIFTFIFDVIGILLLVYIFNTDKKLITNYNSYLKEKISLLNKNLKNFK